MSDIAAAPVDITGAPIKIAPPQWQKKELSGHFIDEVGNQLQDSGAVIPKTCHVCGKDFNSTIQEVSVTEKAPNYTCDSCTFMNTSGDYAWDHEKANPGHTILKTTTDRLVGYKNIITGSVAQIIVKDGVTYVVHSECANGI